MKKAIFLLPFLLTCSFFIIGCSNNYSLANDNISEIRRELYEGNTEDLSASYICGERESEYLMDGNSTPLTEFGVITFYPETESAETPNFILTIDDQIFSGTLEQNPFDRSYVADIEKCLSGTIITAVFISGDISTTIELQKINTDWEITAEKALEITCDKMGSDFNNFIDGENFSGECYIKIVHDSSLSSDSYYWYVNIINAEEQSFSAIIDPFSGDLLAKKSIT